MGTVWQVLGDTQGATGASRRAAKLLKRERTQGLVERNLRSCRLQGWGWGLLMGMTHKLRAEGVAGASQAGVDGKEVWGECVPVPGRGIGTASAKVLGERARPSSGKVYDQCLEGALEKSLRGS